MTVPHAEAMRHLRDVLDTRRHPEIDCPAEVTHDSSPAAAGRRRIRFRGEGLRSTATRHPADAVKIFFPMRRGERASPPDFDGDGRASPDAGFARAMTIAEWDQDEGVLDVLLSTGHTGAMGRWFTQPHTGPGYVWVVGIRTDYVRAPDAERVVIVADAAAGPAAGGIARSFAGTTVRGTVTIVDADAPTIDLAPGVPVDTVGTVCEAVESVRRHVGDPATTHVWMCGEEHRMRRLRAELLEDQVVDQRSLFAAPYWSAGETWEDLHNRQLERVRAASAAGEDVSDPVALQQIAFR